MDDSLGATAVLQIADASRPPRWKRGLDLLLTCAFLFFSLPLWIICFVLLRLTSPGPALHWSKRVGQNNVPFLMPKFRTMQMNTPQVATHLLSDPSECITPMGRFLRKSSLDELPQLWSVLKGDLTLVGPRPALYNQDDLIALRTEAGVHRLTPGLTGWAQVNGRDELEIPVKVAYDCEYMRAMSLMLDLKIICLTVVKVFRADGVRH